MEEVRSSLAPHAVKRVSFQTDVHSNLVSLGAADPLALSAQELDSAFGEWLPLPRAQPQRAQTYRYRHTETVEATNEHLATKKHSTWKPDTREHDECRELEEAARSVHRTIRYFLDVQPSAVGACVLLD